MASPSVFSIEGKMLKLDTNDDVATFVEEIAQLENLKEIRLSGNTIGVEAAQALASAFGKHVTIERAILSDIFTSRKRDVIPEALAALCTALEKQSNLLELDVSDNAFGPVGVPSLAPLLVNNRTLEILRVNNNGLGPEGGSLLSDALQASLQERNTAGLKPTLKTLVCGRNRLENKTATALSKVLPGYTSLLELRLPQNGIRPEGISALMEGLASLKQLEWLDLEDNTITYKAGVHVADTLPSWPSLRKLNLGDCLLGNKTVLALAAKLKDNCNDLEFLNLCYAEAKDDAVIALADILQTKPKLTHLDLNGNSVHPPAEQAVRDALEAIGQSSALKPMDDNQIDDESEDEEDKDEEEDGANEDD